MENLFYLLGMAQILVGMYLVYEGFRWLGYARRRAGTDPGFYSPRSAVFCPCKGVEPGLERNLTALCEFDHQNYEVFFVLASESDPAVSIVKRVAAQSRGKGHVVFAGSIAGRGVSTLNDSALWEGLPGGIRLIAQEGIVVTGDEGPDVLGGMFASGINSSGSIAWLLASVLGASSKTHSG